MASSDFSKEEKVAFDQILEGFEDALSMSKMFKKYGTDQQSMERQDFTIWRPQPYIAQSYDGSDATGNFKDSTQLSVPASIDQNKHSPWTMSRTELLDALQNDRLGKAARQKLASDIEISCSNLAGLTSGLVIKRTVAATGYDDIAIADARMTEQGIMMDDRKMCLNTRDYNAMAGNLAARQTMNDKVNKAYQKGFVGEVSEFDTYKQSYSYRLAAAAGGAALTMDTRAAAGNYLVPQATSVAATGQRSNVDNRYQTVTISSTANVAAGDAFTVDDVFRVHNITKVATAELETFRVVSVTNATTMVITPPMVTAQGGSDAEVVYQNCEVTAEAAAAPIVFLNTVAANVNTFWQGDCFEILPGRIALESDAGVAVIRGATEQGIELVMTKSTDINTHTMKYRMDVRYGVVNLQPKMSGIMLFNQT
ncbi:hypothetical protein N9917_02400 [Deltaproteobacteria bacterium]|nr:hypothetical protein [Deltaproteobacteria bacterium]